ncbi:transcriptional regulator, TetR family [Geodermatophilus amargosae]|uniref:Transcriptional regulator, TetR family n=1 Tax=Geodermatophilus amargosae TaxID=1296565 RepID=A0A1I6Z1C9_9ACTN|nr:helix-turn-helix domain-containing protein [Geodermatophilus amargosae]SFT56503.1 transcriptional regulator, TetR family [Geodermatophilus amargosae]
MDREQPELPPQVALLWGRRGPARRGRASGLGGEAITRATIRVADAEGLAAVSMARVAAELGSAPMSLYRHVDSKDELLLLMSDAALEGAPELAGSDWRERLTAGPTRCSPASGGTRGTGRSRSAGRRWAHATSSGSTVPWAPWPTPAARVREGLVVMGQMPVVHGQAQLSIDLAAGYEADPEAFVAGCARALAAVVDPARYPALSRVMASGVVGPPGQGGDDPPARGV